MADFTSNNEALNENDFRVLSTRDKILKYSAGFIPPSGKPEEESFEELRLLMKYTTQHKTLRFSPWLLAAAAVMMAAIIIYPAFVLVDKKKVLVKFAETKAIVLPDGSEAVINSGSKITYSKRNFTKRRLMKLDGEVFLKVRKGNEFVITTPVGKVEILGTELNIFSRGNAFRVSCITGKVGVTAGGGHELLLPGEYAELTVNGLIKRTSDHLENTVSWKKGEFYFEDQPLVSIFEEIERQFNVTVKSEGLENRFFTGNFSNINLKEALDIVCIPMDLKYEIRERNKVIVINSK